MATKQKTLRLYKSLNNASKTMKEMAQVCHIKNNTSDYKKCVRDTVPIIENHIITEELFPNIFKQEAKLLNYAKDNNVNGLFGTAINAFTKMAKDCITNGIYDDPKKCIRSYDATLEKEKLVKDLFSDVYNSQMKLYRYAEKLARGDYDYDRMVRDTDDLLKDKKSGMSMNTYKL